MSPAFPAIAADPVQASRFLGVFTRTVPIGEFFTPGNLRRMVGTRGLLRMLSARVRRPRAHGSAASRPIRA